MSQTTIVDTIELNGTKSGKITVANIQNPYGEGTDAVASIGVSLDGGEVEWKVHIPMENIDDVIEALLKAK